jgi:glucosamine--fructose-6-phosphate aminotransferase (isomerizing)
MKPENPTILVNEIYQQPSVVNELLEKEKKNIQKIAASLEGRFQYIVIASRGTSDNAAVYAQYLFGHFNHFQVCLATPSLYTYYQSPPNLQGALVIGISQSGQSSDIVSVLEEGRKQGCPTLALVNDPLSPMAQTCDAVIRLHAQPEFAVAATKSYTSALACLAALSCMMSNDESRFEKVLQLPQLMQETIDLGGSIASLAERYRYMENCAVIGRGFSYTTAFELALKIKELSGIIAEPYSSADFRHGPIATATPGFPVILIAPKGAVYQDILELHVELRKRKVEEIIISNVDSLLAESQTPLPIAESVPEWLSPMVSVIPGQLLAMNMALVKGMNVDQPDGLTKVTSTR